MVIKTFSSNSLPRQLVLWSIYAIALLPVEINVINSLCIIAFLAFSLLYNFLQWRQGVPLTKNQHLPLFFLIAGNFILLVISLFYSIDYSNGVKSLGAGLSMLLFPLCFFLLPATVKITRQEMERVLTIFWGSCVVMALWLYFKLWEAGLFPRWDHSTHFITRLRETAGDIIHKHPTYISLYLTFSLFIAFYGLLKTRHFPMKILYAFSIVLFTSLVFALATRMPVIAIFTGIILLLLWKIRSLKLKMTLIAGTVILFVCLVQFVPGIHTRVLEISNTMLKAPVNKEYNSINIRVGIYQCSIKLIKEHWLTGVGIGSDKPLLQECYSTIPTEAYTRTFYNTHNQYMDFLLVTGIFSLALFVGSIVYSLFFAARSGDTVLFFFVIISAISFLSENVLTSQAGVVFYYFFLCLLIHYRKVNRTSPTG